MWGNLCYLVMGLHDCLGSFCIVCGFVAEHVDDYAGRLHEARKDRLLELHGTRGNFFSLLVVGEWPARLPGTRTPDSN